MIRKGLIRITIIGAFLLSSQVQAKPLGKGALGKIFTQDIELDHSQLQNLKQLHRMGKTHHQMRKAMKGKHLEWLETYTEGDISESETIADIATMLAEQQVNQGNKIELMFAFVDSLSDEQKEQALDNLEVAKERYEKLLIRKERAMGKYFTKNKSAVLFEDMDL